MTTTLLEWTHLREEFNIFFVKFPSLSECLIIIFVSLQDLDWFVAYKSDYFGSVEIIFIIRRITIVDCHS